MPDCASQPSHRSTDVISMIQPRVRCRVRPSDVCLTMCTQFVSNPPSWSSCCVWRVRRTGTGWRGAPGGYGAYRVSRNRRITVDQKVGGSNPSERATQSFCELENEVE